MALKTEMTWDKARANRWRKWYRGKLYLVSCGELGTPDTQEGSYQAANVRWRARRAELDRAELAVHPNAGQRAELGRRLESARRQGLGVEAGNIESESRRIKAGGRPASEDEVEILTAAYRALYDEPAPPPERLRDLFGGQERLWEDRLGRAEEAEADRSVGAQIERCLVLEWRRHEAGDLGASEYDVARRSLHLFRDWVGADRPLQALDGDRFEGWWGHLLGPALSRELKLLLHPVRS